jgi:hypothetical protein
MKKYMVADLVKDIKTNRILLLIETFNLTRDQAEYLVENLKVEKEAVLAAYIYVSYNVDISDSVYLADNYDPEIAEVTAKAMTEYDLNMRNAEEFVDNYPNESAWADVEEVAESLGVDITDVEDDDVENYMEMGGNKGEMQSSIGPIQWIYDNTVKAYTVYLVLETAKGPRDIIYRLDRDMMKQWKDSSSIGEHYNNIIRGNKNIEEPPACGCGPNPCEPGQIDQFKNKYASLS